MIFKQYLDLVPKEQRGGITFWGLTGESHPGNPGIFWTAPFRSEGLSRKTYIFRDESGNFFSDNRYHCRGIAFMTN